MFWFSRKTQDEAGELAVNRLAMNLAAESFHDHLAERQTYA